MRMDLFKRSGVPNDIIKKLKKVSYKIKDRIYSEIQRSSKLVNLIQVHKNSNYCIDCDEPFWYWIRPITSKQTEEQKAIAASINNDNV